MPQDLKYLIEIRPADLGDVEAITAIYNDAVLNSVATFDMQPKTLDDRRAWLEAHDRQHPVLVAILDGRVAGWASVSKFADRPAYAITGELSVYVNQQFRGQGIGRGLMEAVIEAARQVGLHTIISRITGGNDVSIHLHESLGFGAVGTMREVGSKFGRLLDLVVMQKML